MVGRPTQPHGNAEMSPADPHLNGSSRMPAAFGPKCRPCRTSEAGCARTNGCCTRCTHNFGETTPLTACNLSHGTIARISNGIAPYTALCLTCGAMTSPQRLISVALDQLARRHGQPSWTRQKKVA